MKKKKQKDDNEHPSTPGKSRNGNDEIVDDEPSEPKPTKKVEPTQKVEPTKKAEPAKKPDMKLASDDKAKDKEQQKKQDGKVKVDVDEPEQKPYDAPPPPSSDAKPGNSNPDSDNTVTLDDNGEDGEVQVTDGDGNVVKESEDEEDDTFMHGQCHQWAWDNWKKGDKFFILTEYDEDIDGQALLHCGLYRNGLFVDASTQSKDIDDILSNFDYGDYDMEILEKDEFKDFCIDFGLPLKN